MRKYDGKNKRNIGIIIGVCIIFAVIFSYFLIKEIRLRSIKYELDTGTVLFDIDKNSILLNSTGIIRKKWSKNYYLTYNDTDYQIGSHVIAFNNNEISLDLYGEFYEVNKDSSVNVTKDETKLNNLNISRFYKIDDRKYLITDNSIKTSDNLLTTSNYLIVELDKQGNAILYNNSVNVKSFGETKIVTSSFTFDVANELLIYEDETIDLKKIIGTTNMYKPSKDSNSGNNGDGKDNTGDNTGGNTGGNNGNTGGNGNNGGNTGGNTGGNNGEVITDNGNKNNTGVSDKDIINSSTHTSIIRITPSINEIKVDYVIYDKLNEYQSVYVEVSSDNMNTNTVYLSKSTTSITLNNLNPGTNYNLTFKYTMIDNDELKEEVIGEYNVTTKMPDVKLLVTKLTNKKITFKVNINNYSISNSVMRLYINGEKANRELNVSGSGDIYGEISLAGLDIPNNSIITLNLEDIMISGVRVDKSVSWSSKVSLSNNMVKPEPEPEPDPEPEPEPENPDKKDDNEEGGN